MRERERGGDEKACSGLKMRGFGTENLRPWEALLLCLRQVETKRIKQMGLNGKSYVPAKKMFGFKPIFKSVLMGCPFGIYRQLDEVFMGPNLFLFHLLKENKAELYCWPGEENSLKPWGCLLRRGIRRNCLRISD